MFLKVIASTILLGTIASALKVFAFVLVFDSIPKAVILDLSSTILLIVGIFLIAFRVFRGKFSITEERMEDTSDA